MQELSAGNLQSISWKNFYDLLKENIKDVKVNGSKGANSKTIKLNTIISQYGEQGFDSSNDYPIIVVEMPTFEFSNISFRDEVATGNIIVECYALQAEARDKFVESITNTIRTNRKELLKHKITLDPSGYILDQDSGQFTRGSLNVHYGKVLFVFQFDFTGI